MCDMAKRGASAIVAYVLLIGFAVTLGIMVSTWMKEQAEKTSQNLIQEKSREVTCTDVGLNAYFLSPACDWVNVTNKGVYSLKRLTFRSVFGSESKDVDILPHQSQDLYISTSTDVEVIPSIVLEGELVGCGNRKIRLAC